MVFTKEDLKRIGNNIAYIRKAYGYQTQVDFALALDPNGHYPRLSYDMIKKYESGRNISEEVIRLISSLTIFNFDEITKEDLSVLEPNSLTLNGEDPKDILNSEELVNEFLDSIERFFPIFNSGNETKDENFNNATKLFNEKIKGLEINEDDVIKACSLLEKVHSPEAFANCLSILGRFYFLRIYCGVKEDILERLNSEHFVSIVEYMKRFQHLRGYEENMKFMAGQKRIFLERYNGLLTHYMCEAIKSDEYKDYVYYFLAVRYYIGLMDNDITKLSDNEMNSFGRNMIECLDILGNKYASDFLKGMNE